MKDFTRLGALMIAFILSSTFVFGQIQLSESAVLVTADIEGYVMNGGGIPISGATVGILDGISTVSDASGYYFFSPDVSGAGYVGFYAWKSDYNYELYPSVWVTPGSVTYQDIILRAPTMDISPAFHEYILNPGEYFTTQTGISNYGDGNLYWTAEVVYPTTDGGNRDVFDCGSASVFGNVPSGFTSSYLSEEGGANQEYQEISGITGDWNTVSFWGIFSEAIPSGLHSFIIEIYESGASPGNLLASISADIIPIPTAEFMQGYPIYYFQTTIDEQSLSDCWIKIASTDLSETFSWLNAPSGSGDAQTWQGSSQLGSHEALAICLESKIVDGWCTLGSYAGINPGYGTLENLVTYFDATVLSAGDILNCDIVFTSHPVYGTYTIPVEMTVDGIALVAPTNFQIALIDSINGYVHMSWDWLTDAFQFFVVYLNGAPIATSNTQVLTYNLPDHGVHCFSVSAFYEEGNTAAVGDCIDWLAPEVFIDPDFHEAWVWVDDTYQWTTTINNLGPGSLFYEFPSPATGYIVDVSPASGIIPDGGSDQVTITWNATGFPPGDYYEDLHCETNDPLNPDVYIENLMHVYTPAYISGIVTDAISHQPINGATVTTGIWQTQTLYDGSYLQAVDAGTYVHYYDKLGYNSMAIPDTSLVAGDTTTIDVELMPESYPVPWVLAETICNEASPAVISWGYPSGPAELIYDDGYAEDLFHWPTANGQNAVLFSASSYPLTVIGGRIYVGDGQWPAGNWMASEFAVLVYDDDGAGGFPGTLLDSIPITVTNYGWIEFASPTPATIDDGEFYISMKQLTNSPAAPLGVDTNIPLENRSYAKSPGGSWGLSSNQDFMIRAYIDGPTVSNPVDYYIIAFMSDFDPNLGPATGTMTILDNVTAMTYTLDAFQLLPEDWHAFAIKAVYPSGESLWTYSNIIGNNMGNEVTFIVSDCLLGPDEGFIVTAYGLDYPYEVFVDTTDINGMCVFDCMWTGNYDYTITKCGYEDFIDNITVSQDITVEITPYNILYKPRNLTVDSITATAYWDEPMTTALLEDFEGNLMPPPGWQMTSNGVGWVQTDDGGSTGFFIPSTGSTYVCVNDAAAGTGNDGCCDMLITPMLDLCEADNYMLSFDSYFMGVNGQIATVEYSLDAGASWINLYTLSPGAGVWEHIEIDLSAFSGANAADEFYLAFHADDGGGQASGWAIDNVDIHAGLPNIEIQAYHVFLDGMFISTSDTTNYTYTDLNYGQIYQSCVAALYDCGLSETTCEIFTSGYLAPPTYLQADTNGPDVELLWVYDITTIPGAMPDVFGFNVYRDSIEIAFVPYSGQDTSYYTDVAPDPMCYDYHVSTLYDMSLYTFPGDTGESQYTGPEEVCLVFGTTLPYNQDWTSGSFEPDWIPGDSWVVNGQIGNPEPSAEFKWDPIMQNYSSVLLSGAFNGVFPEAKGGPYEAGRFILKYDLKLNDVNTTGNEHFICEVWADGQWNTVASYNNADGSFDWITDEIDITDIAFGKVFKVRFVAEGEMSSDILSWFVDNISIERFCDPPRNLYCQGVDPITMELYWEPPMNTGGSSAGEWIMWDDTINVDGIGLTGGGVFSVASRWDADMIAQYDGLYITKIRFFVYANVVNSTYNINIWEGTDAANLVYSQPLSSFIVGDWNEYELTTPVPINADEELWFGYTVDSPDGENPAGCDSGPGVVGYGDMITFDGVVWEPMANYGFDLNWNIHACIADATDKLLAQAQLEDLTVYTNASAYELILAGDAAYKPVGLSSILTPGYHIYFNNNGAGYEWLDITTDTFYIHNNEDFQWGVLYCYYVKAVYGDCEAVSSEACWITTSGIEESSSDESVWIYPNPTKELLHIESINTLSGVNLLDLSGRILQCHELSNETNYTMDVSAYEPGVYLLRIDTEKGRVVRKIVVGH